MKFLSRKHRFPYLEVLAISGPVDIRGKIMPKTKLECHAVAVTAADVYIHLIASLLLNNNSDCQLAMHGTRPRETRYRG